MENNNFNDLLTVKNVQIPLKPAALRIYQSIFPNSKIEDLREKGVKVHILDKEFGIDSLLYLSSGQWFSIQEKYRHLSYWKYHEFTQEFINGDGSQGEWFSLAAQLYFYGWGDPIESIFYEWFILSIPTYKIIIERLGGIESAGKKFSNEKHGKSKFVAIKYETIEPAIIYLGTKNVYQKRLSNGSFSNDLKIRLSEN